MEKQTEQLLGLYTNQKIHNTKQFNLIVTDEEIYNDNIDGLEIKLGVVAYNATINETQYDISYYINQEENDKYAVNDVVKIILIKNEYESDLPNIHHQQKKFFDINLPSDDEITITLNYTKEEQLKSPQTKENDGTKQIISGKQRLQK